MADITRLINMKLVYPDTKGTGVHSSGTRQDSDDGLDLLKRKAPFFRCSPEQRTKPEKISLLMTPNKGYPSTSDPLQAA